MNVQHRIHSHPRTHLQCCFLWPVGLLVFKASEADHILSSSFKWLGCCSHCDHEGLISVTFHNFHLKTFNHNFLKHGHWVTLLWELFDRKTLNRKMKAQKNLPPLTFGFDFFYNWLYASNASFWAWTQELGFLQDLLLVFSALAKHLPAPHANDRLAARKLKRATAQCHVSFLSRAPFWGFWLPSELSPFIIFCTQWSNSGTEIQTQEVDGRQGLAGWDITSVTS